MDIVISHLTRMREGHVCAAGFELRSLAPIRPVLPRPQALPVRLCQGQQPRLRVRSIISAADPKPCGRAPEVEDHEVYLGELHEIRRLEHSEFWRMLSEMVKPNLTSIFGQELVAMGKSFATLANTGAGSLGYIRPKYRFGLYLEVDQFEQEERLRLRYTVLGRIYRLPVTDIRFFSLPDFRINRCAVNVVNGLLKGTEDVILSVGLTRPFMDKHWLQVNNIYFEKTDWVEALD